MGRISVGEALGAGFALIRREPVAFLVWCAIYFLISALPRAVVWPQMMEVYRSIGSNPQAALPAQSRLGAYQPVSLILGLALFAVMPAAIFRAVLFPEDRRFFYLRLGMREFWTFIVTLVVVVMWMIGIIALMVPVGIFTVGVAAAASGAGGAAVAVLVVLVGYFAAIGLSTWFVLRFSLAPVMSFAENTFRVPESWRLTKGHAWRMFLVGLGLFAMVVILEVALLAGAFAFLTVGGSGPVSVFRNPNQMFVLISQVTLPQMLAGSVVLAVLAVWGYVMGGAAWASIYRQLKPPIAETFA